MDIINTDILSPVITLIATIAYLPLIIILLTNRPWGNKHKPFLCFLITALLWSLITFLSHSTSPDPTQPEPVGVRTAICLLVFMLVQLHYFIRLFYDTERIRIWEWLAYLFPIVTLALAAALPESMLVSVTPKIKYGLSPIIILAVFLGIVGGWDVYSLVKRYRLSPNPAERNQFHYLFAAIAILTLSIFLYLNERASEVSVGHIGNLLVACVFTYAVAKHRLLDITVVFRQAIVYVVRYGIGLIIGFGLVAVVLWQQSSWAATRELLPILAAVFFLVIPTILFLVHIPKVRDRWQKWVDRVIIGRRASYQRELSQFIAGIHVVASLEELGSEFTLRIARSLDCKKACLFLSQGDDEGFSARYTYPLADDNPMRVLKFQSGNPIPIWLEREGTILRARKLAILPEFQSMWTEEREEIRSAEIKMFVPLMNKGKLVAILAISERRDGKVYPVDDEYRLESISARVAVSLEKAQLYARLEEESRIDELTGLFNRRHFEERLKEEVSRYSRYGDVFSIFLLDLDNFKNYNDTYGHPAGDTLLTQIGRVIKDSVRNVDQAFRYGGDEFVMILPQTTGENAYVVAERVRVQIAKTTEKQEISVTASIGLASYPADVAVADELVGLADNALYHAKGAGGNQILLASSILSEQLD